MPRNINTNDAILQRLVFELRYRYGNTYLDACGRTINAIQNDYPEWIVATPPSPQQSPLASMENGCTFNFSAEKLDLSLERAIGEPGLSDESAKKFSKQAGGVSAVVIEKLGLHDFSRIGCRAWYLFATSGKKESERQLRELWTCTQTKALEESFGGKLDSSSFVVVVDGNDRKYRISFAGVERQAQLELGDKVFSIRPHALPRGQREALQAKIKAKRKLKESPEFAIMIDVDAFLEDPEAKTIDPGDFIETSLDGLLKRLVGAVS